jgi:hypothetical protein
MAGPDHFRAAGQLLEPAASMLTPDACWPGLLTRFACTTSRLTVSGCGSEVGEAIRRQHAVRRRGRSLT